MSPTMTRTEWKALWESLQPKQQQSIRDKARWEGVTLLGVYRDWPSMFTHPLADGEENYG